MLYYYWCVVFLSFHFNFSENGQKKPQKQAQFEELWRTHRGRFCSLQKIACWEMEYSCCESLLRRFSLKTQSTWAWDNTHYQLRWEIRWQLQRQISCFPTLVGSSPTAACIHMEHTTQISHILNTGSNGLGEGCIWVKHPAGREQTITWILCYSHTAQADTGGNHMGAKLHLYQRAGWSLFQFVYGGRHLDYCKHLPKAFSACMKTELQCTHHKVLVERWGMQEWVEVCHYYLHLGRWICNPHCHFDTIWNAETNITHVCITGTES